MFLESLCVQNMKENETAIRRCGLSVERDKGVASGPCMG